jgi:hypothetical protein
MAGLPRDLIPCDHSGRHRKTGNAADLASVIPAASRDDEEQAAEDVATMSQPAWSLYQRVCQFEKEPATVADHSQLNQARSKLCQVSVAGADPCVVAVFRQR